MNRLTQVEIMNALALGIPLYTHPVKELTVEEIHIAISDILNMEEFCIEDMPSDEFLIEFARAILRKAQQ